MRDQEIVSPPSDLIGATRVSEILGVSRAHVSQSARRAQLAIESGKRYRGKIPLADAWIEGRPHWYRKTIEWLREELK